MSKAFITKTELETPRNASDIQDWIEAKLEEICSDSEKKTALRLKNAPNAKQFAEEAIPLAIFCQVYFKRSRNVTIIHHIGNQNYDVTIQDKRSNKTVLKHLEITLAHEGENDHYRRIILEEDGHVNSLGRISKSGTKNTGIEIKIQNTAVLHSETVQKIFNQICTAAQKKASKKYPPNTGLIIIFDDSCVCNKANPHDIVQLKAFSQEKIMPLLHNFKTIFILGWSSEVFLELTQPVPHTSTLSLQ